MPPWAPGLVTESAPAAQPRRTASASPRSQNATSAPLNVSPAVRVPYPMPSTIAFSVWLGRMARSHFAGSGW